MPGWRCRRMVFAIFLATMVGPSMWNIIIILGAVYWTRYARVIRGEVLSLREREFVKLAEIAGASRTRVILRHILPNVMNSTMVLASLTIGVVIIAEASLSFLGVGVPPPQPAWGSMLADGRSMLMVGDWWLTDFPGLASCWSCWRPSCSATGCASASIRSSGICDGLPDQGPAAP